MIGGALEDMLRDMVRGMLGCILGRTLEIMLERQFRGYAYRVFIKCSRPHLPYLLISCHSLGSNALHVPLFIP